MKRHIIISACLGILLLHTISPFAGEREELQAWDIRKNTQNTCLNHLHELESALDNSETTRPVIVPAGCSFQPFRKCQANPFRGWDGMDEMTKDYHWKVTEKCNARFKLNAEEYRKSHPN